ncbi:MAG: ABC transporter ATP-binding protein [Anaerolineales bacterium]|nr:ABC transporter ATP-binding protein [Anaerolineales bacterium]
MSQIALKAVNLSKQYHIGRLQAFNRTFRESIMDAFNAPFRRAYKLIKGQSSGVSDLDEVIWALDDVSFEVYRGEVVGIIGSNGAGKSTLLKIISRITKPTTGYAHIYGRVGSLLEVGTGFHSEMTGRENIHLNGSILGMKRKEIEKNFDEIVEFAEIEKFLDTPVKHYSTGMYLRLAFAVAAHMEPEILLVDEVLSVGDAQFQKKCLGKLDKVSHEEGRTVLFVSHNTAAVKSLCSRAIWINKGQIVQDGPTNQVVNSYLNFGSVRSCKVIWSENERPGNKSYKLVSIDLKNVAGDSIEEIDISQDAVLEIEFEVIKDRAQVIFSLVLSDVNDYVVLSSLSNIETNELHGKYLPKGRYCSRCYLYGNLLNNGTYSVSIIGAAEYYTDAFRVDQVISFEAIDDGVLKRDYSGEYSGVIRPKLVWTTTPVDIPTSTLNVVDK